MSTLEYDQVQYETNHSIKKTRFEVIRRNQFCVYMNVQQCVVIVIHHLCFQMWLRQINANFVCFKLKLQLNDLNYLEIGSHASSDIINTLSMNDQQDSVTHD